MTKRPLTSLEERTLLVVYELCGGREGVNVPKSKIEARIVELNLYNMTTEQYEAYRQQVKETVRRRRELGNEDLS